METDSSQNENNNNNINIDINTDDNKNNTNDNGSDNKLIAVENKLNGITKIDKKTDIIKSTK